MPLATQHPSYSTIVELKSSTKPEHLRLYPGVEVCIPLQLGIITQDWSKFYKQFQEKRVKNPLLKDFKRFKPQVQKKLWSNENSSVWMYCGLIMEQKNSGIVLLTRRKRKRVQSEELGVKIGGIHQSGASPSFFMILFTRIPRIIFFKIQQSVPGVSWACNDFQ